MPSNPLRPVADVAEVAAVDADLGHPRCRCADSHWTAHHDRLLLVEADLEVLLELLELAITWTELDYSHAAVIPPDRWTAFAVAHPWREPSRMERAFGLAADVALRPVGGGAGGTDLLRLVAGDR